MASKKDGNIEIVDVRYRIAVRVAVVAAVFSVLVGASLLGDYAYSRISNPLDAPGYVAMKELLAKQPQNQELKGYIRQVDLGLRSRYFQHRRRLQVGSYLLLAGVLIFVFAMKSVSNIKRHLPMPGEAETPKDLDARTGQLGRRAVVVLAMSLVAGALVLDKVIFTEGQCDSELDTSTSASIGVADTEPSLLTSESIQNNWHRFRGPHGAGVSAVANVPTVWDVKAGRGLLWKAVVPLPGKNSPVVWGKMVFLTGAIGQEREVYAFDADTGELVWRKGVPGTPESRAKVPKVSEDTGYAAPTAVTDGRRVFAIFANGDIVAIDFRGETVWAVSLGIPDSIYGFASSLAIHENFLIVQFDQGTKVEGKSRLLAIELTTGEVIWEVKRGVPNSWPSPIVIENEGRDQVVTAADPWVISYDPLDGNEIWRAKCLRQDVGPSPTFAGGTVFVANEFPCLSAIDAGGQGDVTKTRIKWQAEDGLPDVASPLAAEDFVFLLASYGTLTCYDVKTGELLWEEDFDASFTSSPSLAGKNIYLFADDGRGFVVEPSRSGCKLVSETDLGEPCVTSPAILDGRLYIRGEKHLFCIVDKN